MVNFSILIEDIDEVYVSVLAERGILQELSERFEFYAQNYKYMKRYKESNWDGKIRLFSPFRRMLYKGLVDEVYKFAEEKGYEVFYEPEERPEVDFKAYLDSKEKKFEPYDYQYDCIEKVLNNRRHTIVSPTGSGKSYIIYWISRFLSDHKKNVLIVVPTVSLVHQIYSDFEDYSIGWDVEKKCHKIYQGQDKSIRKRVTITTWQSIYKLQRKWFDGIDCVIADECHMYKSNELTQIVEKCKNAEWKTGLTGTLDDIYMHELTLTGLFGPTLKNVSSKELMERDILSKLKINLVGLKYKNDICRKIVNWKNYQKEIDFLVKHEPRNKFIKNLCQALNGNTLVLFQYVDKHGKKLYDMLSKIEGKTVFFVHGKVSPEEREKVRRTVSERNDVIIVASYGTFSTGINAPALHNLVIASPTKSKVRILQSIGRGLRKSENKTHCRVFDIFDVLVYNDNMSYSMKHSDSRIVYYTNEKFDVESHSYDLF